MTQGENIQLISSLVIIAFLITGLFTRSNHKGVPLLRYSLYWAGIFVVALMLYAYKDYIKEPLDKMRAVISPATPIEEHGVIKIQKSLDGHFHINALVNGKKMDFLIDTGATEVLLSKADAAKVGIDIDKLEFTIRSYTASGTTMIARANVSIKISNFEIDDFPIYVNSSESDSALLGMSLLSKMQSVSFEGAELILKY